MKYSIYEKVVNTKISLYPVILLLQLLNLSYKLKTTFILFLIYNMASITLVKGDCITELDQISDKSAQLICIAPPYNIGKDTWDNISNYQEFILTVIKKLEMKLRDNGSFFMFHNDMETICEIMMNIKQLDIEI